MTNVTGIYIVGNVGRHQGSLKWALLGAYLCTPLIYLFNDPTFYIAIVTSLVFNRYGKQWKRTPTGSRSFIRRMAFLSLLGIIYLQLWGAWFCFNCTTTNNEGETIKCFDSMMDFFESPSWKQFQSAMQELKLYIQIHGIGGFFQNVKAWIGEDLEKDALEVFELHANASREEITKKYRQLVRQWHPDKQKDPSKREEAQNKFIEISEAYQILMKIK